MDRKGKAVIIDSEDAEINSLLDLTLSLGGLSSSPFDPETSQATAARGRPLFANSVNCLGSSSDTVTNDQATAYVSGVDSFSSETNINLNIWQQANPMGEQHLQALPELLDQFCLINISSRKGSTGGSKKRNPSRRPPPKEDESRTCSNFYCQVKTSPMWRKGPLGPKTLCNRCGIRYRKMKVKEDKERRAAEAARRREG